MSEPFEDLADSNINTYNGTIQICEIVRTRGSSFNTSKSVGRKSEHTADLVERTPERA